MTRPNNPYRAQLALLVQLLSFVGREECFALKGGTAINLFYRDLPRYSVDIDLTYLPGGAFNEAAKEISSALERICDLLTMGSPSFPVTRGAGTGTGPIDTLMVGGVGAQVKIEVNPVLRGSIHSPTLMRVRDVVSEEFGFAEMKVMAFDDVYAGKLVAAHDRQHPRDLFDVKLLLENEGISESLFKAFIVYLVGHKGSIPNVLNPLGKKVDIETMFRKQFVGMTVETVELKELLETRERMASEIRSRIDEKMKRFLLSVQRGEPEWPLLAVKGAEALPAVKWRMHNLSRMKPEAMKREVERLEKVLNS
jgi:predicted nucleotidyltransferase component of viral defense system